MNKQLQYLPNAIYVAAAGGLLAVTLLATRGEVTGFELAMGAVILLLLPVALLTDLACACGRSRKNTIVLSVGALLALFIAFLVFAHPSERFTSDNDQGLYGLTAWNILETGDARIHVSDGLQGEILDGLTIQTPVQALRSGGSSQKSGHYMGFLVSGEECRPFLISQFPVAYPASMAMWGRLFGADNMNHVNWFWLGCAVILAARFAARTAGTTAATLTLLGGCLLPLNVWMANTMYSELMLATCVMLVASSLVSRRDEPGLLVTLLGGSLWSTLAILVKVEGVLISGVFVLYILFISFRDRRPVMLLFAVVPAFALAETSSGYAIQSLTAAWKNFGWLAVAGATLAAATAVLMWRARQKLSPKAVWWTCVVAMVVGCVFFYLAYPALMKNDRFFYWPMNREIPSLRGETFKRLGWYFTAPGLFLALGGMLWIARESATKRCMQSLAFVTLGGAVVVLLAFDVMNNPLQPYAMRRFVAYSVFPLLVGLCKWAEPDPDRKWSKWIRYAAPLGVLTLIAWFTPTSYRLSRTADHGGLLAAVKDFANRIPGDWAFVDQRGPLGELAAPLAVIADKQVIVLPGNQDKKVTERLNTLTRELVAQGVVVTWLGETSRGVPRTQQTPFKQVAKGVIAVNALAQSYESLSFQVATKRWRYWLYCTMVEQAAEN